MMNLKFSVAIALLLIAGPCLAEGSDGSVPARDSSAVEAQAEEKKKEELTLEELAAKVARLAEDQEKTRSRSDLLSRLKISGYLQAQYVDDASSSNELSGSSTRNRDQFSVRRGRVKFTYQATPTSRFVLQPDISSSGTSLKDGYVELIEPWTSWKHTLTAGQFIWPFGFELVNSSSSREMPERARVVRTLFAGERDRGVMLSGSGFDGFSYNVAIVNGTATQSFDPNKRKDVVGRVGYNRSSFGIGLSAYRGAELVATQQDPTGAEFDRTRQGVDVHWQPPVKGLRFRGEYITGRQAPAAGTFRTRSHDTDGWLLYAIQKVGKRHQFVLRLDEYDPDTDVDGNAVRTLGGSYIFQWDTNSKVMLAYERPKHETSDPDDNLFTLRYQFSF